MTKTGIRWWLTTYAIPGLLLAGAVAVLLLFADRLPDPLARHWDFSGQPDGASPLWAMVLLAGGITALAWAMLVVADRSGTSSSSLVAFVYFMGATLVGVQTLTVWANLDAPSWQSAGQVGLAQIVAVLGGASLIGAIGWFLAGGGPAIPYQAPETPIATVGLEPGKDAVWVGKSESYWIPMLGVGFLVAAAVVLGWVGILLLAISWLAIFFSAARVAVNDQGVNIGLGWWGWPRKLIPLDDISRAEILAVEPMSFGGWGLRVIGGRALTGTWALIIRRGPGIRLVRPDHADLVVTVDDPQQGAGLINDLLSRNGRVGAR